MKDYIIPVKSLLGECYKLGSTVSGTRNNHYFSTTEIRRKHVSVDPEFYVYHSFSQSEENQHNQIIKSLKKMDITCQYDNFWWLALIDEVDLVEKEVYAPLWTYRELLLACVCDDIANVTTIQQNIFESQNTKFNIELW